MVLCDILVRKMWKYINNKALFIKLDSVVHFWAGRVSNGHLLLLCSLTTWVMKQSPHKKLRVDA